MEALDEVGAPLVVEPDLAQPTLVADVNEPPDLLEMLEARHVRVERRRLAPADFLVGPLAIERKSVGDFHASMINKRLFEQLARLKETYPPPVALLLEGDLSFIEERRQPRATWGALSAATIDMGITILPTPSKEASADLLSVLARRAGRGEGGRAEIRFKPRLLSPGAQQRFAAQGLPGVGDVLSDNLLRHFGSLRRLYAATERELLRVPGVGKLRAREVAAFLDAPYAGRQTRIPDDKGEA